MIVSGVQTVALALVVVIGIALSAVCFVGYVALFWFPPGRQLFRALIGVIFGAVDRVIARLGGAETAE